MPQAQSMMQKARRLLKEEADLGEPHRDLPDLSGRVILVIGGSKPSGFGYNFARVAITEAKARAAVITASSEKSRRGLESVLSGVPWKERVETAVCNVTAEDPYGAAYDAMVKYYGRLDAVVVCPAYLNPKYFEIGKTWDDVSPDDKALALRVTAYAINDATAAFAGLLSQNDGVVFGLGSGLYNLPGYPLGEAKRELSHVIVDVLAPQYAERGIRVNELQPGYWESLSSSVIESAAVIPALSEALHIETPSLGWMVREAVACIPDLQTGHTYVLDGGFAAAVNNPANQAIVEQVYADFLAKAGA